MHVHLRKAAKVTERRVGAYVLELAGPVEYIHARKFGHAGDENEFQIEVVAPERGIKFPKDLHVVRLHVSE